MDVCMRCSKPIVHCIDIPYLSSRKAVSGTFDSISKKQLENRGGGEMRINIEEAAGTLGEDQASIKTLTSTNKVSLYQVDGRNRSDKRQMNCNSNPRKTTPPRSGSSPPTHKIMTISERGVG